MEGQTDIENETDGDIEPDEQIQRDGETRDTGETGETGETIDERRETRDDRQETRDDRQETRDERRETRDDRQETRETRDREAEGQGETGEEKLTAAAYLPPEEVKVVANSIIQLLTNIIDGAEIPADSIIHETLNGIEKLGTPGNLEPLTKILQDMMVNAKKEWETMINDLESKKGYDVSYTLSKHIDKKPNFTDYYYNNMANISIKNNKIDEHIAKHKLEIEYALNDIYIKDNEIEILKLVITGTLLSLLTIAINKFLGFNLHIINIICIIVSIFVFLILIRVIINMNKKNLNFMEFNYAKSPKEYGFFDKLSKLFSDLIPSFKLRESQLHNNIIYPSGNY